MKIYLLQFFLLIGLGLNLQAQIPSNPIRGKVTCNGTGVPGGSSDRRNRLCFD